MAKNKHIPHHFDLNPNANKGGDTKQVGTIALIIIIAALVIVLYMLGVFGGGSQEAREVPMVVDNPTVSALVDITGGDGESVEEFISEENNIKTTDYFVFGRVQDELIADMIQYFTQNGWGIRSGTDLPHGGYLMSVFNEETGQNMQIDIIPQPQGHVIAITYIEL